MDNAFRKYLESLAPISEADFRASMAYFQPLQLDKGQFFVRQLEVARQVAFIVSGIIRTYYVNEKGEDITYCFCTEGRFSTSFKSFITQSPSALTMQAIEGTELLVINYWDLQELYKVYPAWQQIGRIATEREYLVMEKYASVLNNETALEKYQRLVIEEPVIVQRAPVKHIASYLGISRETLSRIRKQVMG